MQIKNIKINNKTALAPMAGVNCTAFRLLCKKYGAGLIYTQMYDVNTIIEKESQLKEFLNIQKEESPIAIQLIGNVDDNWEKAVTLIEKYADIIDINLGCAEEEFIQKKAGSYLMQYPESIKIIVKKCISSTKKPVTAKIRSGYDKVNAVEIAKLLEKEGISAIAIHPRTKEQKYGDKANLTIIKEVKENVSIPVIGSGDIILPGHAKAMIEKTKCDMVMIGRTAMRNPEIFSYVNYILEHGKNKTKITDDTKNPKRLIKEFLFLYTRFEKRHSLNEVKDHCIWILQKTKGAPRVKEEVKEAKTIEDIKSILK